MSKCLCLIQLETGSGLDSEGLFNSIDKIISLVLYNS